jgi:hypothetical protein
MDAGKNLLSSLALRGVRVWRSGDSLLYSAPRGSVTSSDIQAIRSLKAEILALLSSRKVTEGTWILPREVGVPIPLTALQRVWCKHVNEQDGGSSPRLTYIPIRVAGPLNTALLREALNVVICRHEALRTTIVSQYQRVGTAAECPFDTVDLSQLPSKVVRQEALRLASQFVTERINLATGPLFEARLYRLSAQEHALILAFEHAITDAKSNSIVFDEAWSWYEHAVRGERAELPAAPLQFADYAVWQDRSYDTWYRKHAAYWRARLSDCPRTTLPPVSDAAGVGTPDCEIMEIPFGSALSEQLRKLARREGMLLPVVVLSIYFVVMSRVCERRELVISVPSSGRLKPELETVVGFVANVQFLRVELTSEDSFLDVLNKVNAEVCSAYEHFDFSRAMELFPKCYTEVVFNWLPTSYWARGALGLDDGRGESVKIDLFPLKVLRPFKFGVAFFESQNGITALLFYRPDVFPHEAASNFVDLLTRVATDCATIETRKLDGNVLL